MCDFWENWVCYSLVWFTLEWRYIKINTGLVIHCDSLNTHIKLSRISLSFSCFPYAHTNYIRVLFFLLFIIPYISPIQLPVHVKQYNGRKWWKQRDAHTVIFPSAFLCCLNSIFYPLILTLPKPPPHRKLFTFSKHFILYDLSICNNIKQSICKESNIYNVKNNLYNLMNIVLIKESWIFL